MSTFTFRQRVGKLDWKAVSSVNTNHVVLTSNIRELQQVVDAVTFCHFGEDDIKNCTVENIGKVISIQQLITEYLLHCQEAQFKAMRDSQKKQDKLKKLNDRLKKENVSLTEDRRIYQRQLAMLRKTLPAIPGMPLNMDNYDSPNIPPRVFSLLDADDVKESKKTGAGIVDTLLKRELETRDFMATLLDDQRKTFADQIQLIIETIGDKQQQQQNDNNRTPRLTRSSSFMAEDIPRKVERAVTAAMESLQNTIEQSLAKHSEAMAKSVQKSSNATASKNDDGDRDIAMLLKQAAAEEYEEELQEKEQQLEQRARRLEVESQKLRAKEVDLQMQKSSNEIKAQLSIDSGEKSSPVAKKRSIGETSVVSSAAGGGGEQRSLLVAKLNAVNAILTLNARRVAAQSLTNLFWGALLRRKRAVWHIWYQKVQAAQLVEREKEEAKLITYAQQRAGASSSRSPRHSSSSNGNGSDPKLSELQQALSAEQNKSEQMLATHTRTQQDLDQARQRIAELESKLSESQRRTKQQEEELTALKAAAAVAAAEVKAPAVMPKSREEELLQLLQGEKEKAVINAARFNTLRSKTEKEIASLTQQLEDLQRQKIGHPTSEAGVGTSMEFLPRNSYFQPQTTTTSIGTGTGASISWPRGSLLAADLATQRHQQLRASIRGHSFLADAAADEQSLMADVEHRIAMRLGGTAAAADSAADPLMVEHMEQQAMAALAQDLTARMQSQQPSTSNLTSPVGGSRSVGI